MDIIPVIYSKLVFQGAVFVMSHILEHDKKNIHVWKVSEKGQQCIKAASLYETFKIEHPSFNILIIIIITFTSIAPFSLLSNSNLQQQLLKKKINKMN